MEDSSLTTISCKTVLSVFVLARFASFCNFRGLFCAKCSYVLAKTRYEMVNHGNENLCDNYWNVITVFRRSCFI